MTCKLAKVLCSGAVDLPSVSKLPFEQLELSFGTEFPTERAPERAAAAARAALQRRREQENWCDSEAPTRVAAERPLFPRPPRSPKL